MKRYSSPCDAVFVRVMLASMDRCSFLDHRDGCRVVEMGCERCECMFKEELEAAKSKISGGDCLLCIRCDPAASAPSVSGVIIRGRDQ